MLKGSCLCGAVAFDVSKTPQRTVACHCGQCRKMSGHLWAAAIVDEDDISFTKTRSLKWFASSNFARRGFCAECGSSLFWKHTEEPFRAVALGAFFDSPADLKLQRHIMGSRKGDYYDIHDQLPVED